MTYPAAFTLEPPEKVANWRPLVQWLLAIPHFIAAYVLNIVAAICVVIAWFAILITGKMPQGLADFICLGHRYQGRAMAYAGFLHAEYPPFDFSTTAADPGGQPVRFDYEPALEDRNRLTVLLRIFWMIPAYIFFYVIYLIAGIVWFISFFAVLFTGKWPGGLLNFATGAIRVATRFGAYASLLTDEYPPFNLD